MRKAVLLIVCSAMSMGGLVRCWHRENQRYCVRETLRLCEFLDQNDETCNTKLRNACGWQVGKEVP